MMYEPATSYLLSQMAVRWNKSATQLTMIPLPAFFIKYIKVGSFVCVCEMEDTKFWH